MPSDKSILLLKNQFLWQLQTFLCNDWVSHLIFSAGHEARQAWKERIWNGEVQELLSGSLLVSCLDLDDHVWEQMPLMWNIWEPRSSFPSPSWWRGVKRTDVVVNVMDDRWILEKHRFRVVKVLMFQEFLLTVITVFMFCSLFQHYCYTKGGMRHTSYTCICGT